MRSRSANEQSYQQQTDSWQEFFLTGTARRADGAAPERPRLAPHPISIDRRSRSPIHGPLRVAQNQIAQKETNAHPDWP